MNETVIVGTGFIGGGLLFLMIGLLMNRTLKRRRKLATAYAEAVVLEIYSYCKKVGKRKCYSPVYEFYAEGKQQKVRSDVVQSNCFVKAGETVELYYIPGQPDKVYVKKERRGERGAVIFFCAVGLFYPLLGILRLLGMI